MQMYEDLQKLQTRFNELQAQIDVWVCVERKEPIALEDKVVLDSLLEQRRSVSAVKQILCLMDSASGELTRLATQKPQASTTELLRSLVNFNSNAMFHLL